MRDSVEAAYIGALRLWYIPLIFKLEVNDVIKETFVKINIRTELLWWRL